MRPETVHLMPPAVNGYRARDDVADEAYEIAMDALRRFGNEPSEDHAQALRVTLYAMAQTARARGPAETPRRLAIPLPVGTGKTLAVAAFAVAAYRYARDRISLVVAQERVEQLIRLRALMIDLGLPADAVGVLHSQRYSPDHADACRRLQGPPGFASEPSIDRGEAGRYPFLLVSHEALRVRQDIHELARDRSLVVWDEALLKSRGRSMVLAPVRAAIAAAGELLKARSQVDRDAADALGFLRYAVAEIDADVARQAAGRHAMTLRLPEKTETEMARWKDSLFGLMNPRTGLAEAAGRLADFLELTRAPLRAVSLNGQAAIRYEVVIPAELRRVIVLDASHNIRELTSGLDADLHVVPELPARVKDFGDVTVNQLVHGGGRSTIDSALRAPNSPLLRAIVERIAGYREDLAVTVFTYKHRPTRGRNSASHAELIQRELRKAGIDPDARLDGRPRFRWPTWGMELGLNDYADSEYVLLVGIYRKSREDVAAAIAGQLDDLSAPEAGCPETIRRVELSELGHALYQAAGRGHCRKTVNGKAGTMQLDWIGLEAFGEGFWAQTFPGAEIGRWESRHLAGAPTMTRDAADAIADYLGALDSTVDAVSSRKLKESAGLSTLDRTRFKRAREQAIARAKGWAYDARRQGFVRAATDCAA